MASLTKSDSSHQKDLEKLKQADTTKRLKRLRTAMDDGEAKEMSHYPRTKKERKNYITT